MSTEKTSEATYLIRCTPYLDKDFTVLKFDSAESIKKYLSNNPTLSFKDFVIIHGTMVSAVDRTIKDGRFL